MYVESMEGGASDLVAEMERVSVSDKDLSGSGQVASTSAIESKADEIRTIFVLGFPRDMKERELHNLLRWWPGYVACQLTQGSGDQQAMGFALFEKAPMAMAAKDALQNLVFDSETNSVLRAEMAKKNLYVRKSREGGNDAQSDLRRIRGGGESRRSSGEQRKQSPSSQDQGGGSGAVGAYNWQGNQGGYMQQPSYNAYANYFAAAAAMGAQQSGQLPPGAHPMHMHPPQMAPMMLAGYAPVQNTKDNLPCNTLFVGNLSESVLESELRGLFHSQPGFRQMKILRQQNGTTCFVEFMDIPSAMNVHHNLQGAILASSTDKGGMRIQYSKNPYGRKREAAPPSQDDPHSGEDHRGPRVASF